MRKHQLNLKVLREWMAEGMTPDRQTIAALDYSMALMLCVERKRTCKANEAHKLTARTVRCWGKKTALWPGSTLSSKQTVNSPSLLGRRLRRMVSSPRLGF